MRQPSLRRKVLPPVPLQPSLGAIGSPRTVPVITITTKHATPEYRSTSPIDTIAPNRRGHRDHVGEPGQHVVVGHQVMLRIVAAGQDRRRCPRRLGSRLRSPACPGSRRSRQRSSAGRPGSAARPGAAGSPTRRRSGARRTPAARPTAHSGSVARRDRDRLQTQPDQRDRPPVDLDPLEVPQASARDEADDESDEDDDRDECHGIHPTLRGIGRLPGAALSHRFRGHRCRASPVESDSWRSITTTATSVPTACRGRSTVRSRCCSAVHERC